MSAGQTIAISAAVSLTVVTVAFLVTVTWGLPLIDRDFRQRLQESTNA